MTKPWNKDKLVGPKRQLDRDSIAALRHILARRGTKMEVALFETALSTMLRASDVLQLTVGDILIDPERPITTPLDIKEEMSVVQQKTGRPVRVLVSDRATAALYELVEELGLAPGHYLFAAHGPVYRAEKPFHLVTYGRYVKRWAGLIGLNAKAFGTHSMRRTRAALYYEETGDIRAVQLMLGHRNIAATQRYLGVEESDALDKFRAVKV